MSLTLQQAQQAGQIADQIIAYEAVVTELQAVVTGGQQIQSMSAIVVGNGAQLSAGITLSVADTATMFNGLIGIYSAQIAALQAELAALG